MDEKLRKEGYELLMELAKDPGYLISLAKIGAKARESAKKVKAAMAPKPRFYKGQPVLVSQDKERWVKGHFDSYMKTPSGDTVGYQPFVVWHGEGTRWHNCKPDPDAVSLPNWVEYDESQPDIILCPDNSFIISQAISGSITQLKIGVDFRARISINVARYCIIPLPEFVDQ